MDTSDKLNLSYEREVKLINSYGINMKLERIQGGEFSDSGHLFLLAEEGFKGSGIYIFDVNGRNNTAIFLNFIKMKTEGDQEFEGITIWDLDYMTNNGGITGQIHAINYEPDNCNLRICPKVTWKFWFKHFQTNESINEYQEVKSPTLRGEIRDNKPYLEWDDFGSDYTYKIYESNSAPGHGYKYVTTTSNNHITIPLSLSNEFQTGINYPVRYYVYSYKNGLKSSRSNAYQFTYEYVETDPDPLPCFLEPCHIPVHME